MEGKYQREGNMVLMTEIKQVGKFYTIYTYMGVTIIYII